ncbi:prion-like-(Q/N-rich) domain-bearing protein 25 [Phlebotomus papatasi]|uniref:prion-like-(Q/N-rich) domain-bearing protein 25 n=1 Tax=Phlebotomus papatasi TaxID=29031 RepID=UPI00248469E8|nr:prion-like-(Q/N-rich) domain-bearing protein 25 [Phlebotomus papatasi]
MLLQGGLQENQWCLREDCKCMCHANEEYTFGHDCFEKCINTKYCEHYVQYKRCFCLPNYKRINGVCIPESNCPCPQNEQYWVGNECMDTEGTDVMNCVNSPLYHGCYCKRGHRRIDGECVPYGDFTCDQNEYFTISNTCMEQCFANPIECAQEYAYGLCLCFPGYVRINGFCVPDTNCPCGQNEEYTFSSECIERCEDEQTCKNEYQYKRCTCRDGFKRINGNCVLATVCPCPPNESVINTNDCFETCGTNYLDCATLPIVRRCSCNWGYVRINGVCVERTACGSTCPENEVYGLTNTCYEDCYRNPKDCRNEFSYQRCGCAQNCKRINGTCVPDKYCHCGPHEVYRYGNECYDYCHDDYHKCAAYGTYKGCFCSEGCKRFDGVCKPKACPQYKKDSH